MLSFLPSFFLIYGADIDLWVKHCDPFGFADDTTTVLSEKDEEVLKAKINEDDENVLSFLNSNSVLVSVIKALE